MNPDACPKCGGPLWEDLQTGLRVCEECSWGFTTSGKAICPACVEEECERCVYWTREESCYHECFYQRRYGEPEKVGYVTADDW
jgi:hypothetical protein